MHITRNIKNTKWPTTPSLKKWNREIKQLKDMRLVKIIKSLLKVNEPRESSSWAYAGLAVSELYIRNWGKRNLDKLGELREAILKTSTLCFTTGWYALETAGIAIDKKKRKIIHPYALSDTAKAVVTQWEDSRTSKSFEEFLVSHAAKADLKHLKNHTVTYLSPKKLNKHLVSFENGQIKIGGKTPKDEWYIFVLENEPQRLFAGIKKIGALHHTSFVSGGPVSCAGEFKVEDGKIVSIPLRSGHYRPSEEHGIALHNFLAEEQNLGPEIMRELEVEPYKK